jgi:PAS domain S-box-containing protein
VFELNPDESMDDVQEIWRLIHPDDRETVERGMFRSAETLEPNRVAYRLVLKEKGTRWVESWSLPSRLENGDIVFDGIVIDVTDLGRLDSLQREINFKQVFDSAPDAVFLIVADGEDQGRIAAANKAAEIMHGYEAGELKGTCIRDLDTPDDALEASERLRRLAKGEVLRFEVNHVHKDGSTIPVEVTASRILIDNRPYILAFDRDISQRKKAEAERRELQAQLLQNQKLAAELNLTKTQSQLRRITDNFPGMVYQYVLHADGSDAVTYISAKCRQMFGVEPEEVLEDPKALWKWIQPEDFRLMKEKFNESARTIERFAYEYRVALPGQGIRWFRAETQPELQPNGDVIWDGVVLDVTDRREVELANKALAKATQTKDQFLANMSHELRTPLSAILGMTEGLKQGLYGETTEGQLATLGVVEESGLHLLELINEILDLAKIETGNASLNFSSVDVAELCKSCLDFVSPQAKQKRIKLLLNSDWNLPRLQADQTKLRQILINLLGNAIKFTPEGGKVELEVEERSAKATSSNLQSLRFTVADNGIGIQQHQIDTLFEPFVQVDNSHSRKYPGSGLGLSLAKRFVELHSGTISVQSELGEGSRFIVDLPQSKPDSKSANPPAGPATDLPADKNAAPDSEPLILLAEDNDHVAMAFIPILEVSGFRVLRARDGKAAVRLTQERSPDLILMDIQMPVMDGLEAIRQIRTHKKSDDTPIIAISGFAMPKDSSRCIEAGANAFLAKPCKMPELVSKIRQLISSRRPI